MLTGLLTCSLTFPFTTAAMKVATVNFFILLAGFSQRKKSIRNHATLMSLGVASDLTLVGVLQFQRNAVQTALEFKLSALNQGHILFSTLATTLYVPTIILGIQLIRRSRAHSGTTLHGKIGALALFCRCVGFFLMFSMLGKN